MAYDPYSYYSTASAAAPSYSHRRPTTTFSGLFDDDPYRRYYAAAAAPSYSQGLYYYHRPTTTFVDMMRARAAASDVSSPVSRDFDAKPEVPNKAPKNKNRKPAKKKANRKHKHKKSTPIRVAEPEAVAEEMEAAAATVDEAWEMAELFAVAAEHGGEIQAKEAAEMEEAEPAPDKPDGSDADAEWEIVKEEEPAVAAACPEAPRHDPAAAGIVDTGKLMEMVVALCERNAMQCALIGALVERMDALERTLRRA